jgi:EAL domain-containing protein (putative c-di-GMP-specific phosphodiesterase class I)
VAAEDVILEITESGLLNELSHTLEVLTRLRVKSVKLSIDDFGTGFAMMQQLINIPANELKIDRSFVMNMHVNSSDRVMVQKSIEIGHALGMAVIAEGVETEEQLQFLREGECDSAQGYLFTRPLPPDKLVGWLAEYQARLDSVSPDRAAGEA